MKKGKLKLPVVRRYRKQVKTFVGRYGRQGYQLAGARGGGKNSPGSFTSDQARQASLISWEKRRARQAAAEKEKNGNENGLSTNEKN